jgi:hypothetical protein
VAGCCEYGDEPSVSGARELVSCCTYKQCRVETSDSEHFARKLQSDLCQ